MVPSLVTCPTRITAYALLLGQSDQFASGGANLGHRPWSGFVGVAPHGLDGVDHDQIETVPLQAIEDFPQAGLGS